MVMVATKNDSIYYHETFILIRVFKKNKYDNFLTRGSMRVRINMYEGDGPC